MAKTADQIRREIDQTRDNLGETLEAISERVNPRTVAQRVREDVSEKVNPKRIFKRKTERLRHRSDGTKTNGNGNGVSRGPVATRTRSVPTAEAKSLPAEAVDTARDNPLAAGAVAFGSGIAIAALLRPTGSEKKAASRVRQRVEPIKQKAIEAGKNVAGEVQPLAQNRINRVKTRATEAADKVKSGAQASARDVKNEAKTATRQVKGKAKTATRQVKGEAKTATRQVKGKAKAGTRPTSSRPGATKTRPAARRTTSTGTRSASRSSGTSRSRAR